MDLTAPKPKPKPAPASVGLLSRKIVFDPLAPDLSADLKRVVEAEFRKKDV
jgi:hypothetical protein